MSSKRLILKNRHWRYTIISSLLVAPVFLTLIAVIASWLFGYGPAKELLVFMLNRQPTVLTGIWIVCPLLGLYLASISYQRGTIDRWRPINKTTKIIAIISLAGVLVLAALSRFI